MTEGVCTRLSCLSKAAIAAAMSDEYPIDKQHNKLIQYGMIVLIFICYTLLTSR